jgi:hypothetical protein
MKRRGRLRRLWAAVKKRLPGLRGWEPPEAPWFPDEPALVPVGPPRGPLPASSVALEPPSDPDPLEYPVETDAVGRDPEDDDPRE